MRPLLWLGSISYARYLVQQNVGCTGFWRLTQAGLPLSIAIPLMLLLTLGLAHLIRNYVEEPSQQAPRKWWRARAQQRSSGNTP